MKAALIPPKGYEASALMSDIHLFLPLAELVRNEDYITTAHQAKERGDYVILDNGCAEGRLVPDDDLLDFAAQIHADEVVAPDVMGSMQHTMTATKAFFRTNRRATNFNVMGVLQGRDQEELWRLLAAYDSMAIHTIGIPKFHVKSKGDGVRARIAGAVMQDYPGRFEIHLLGLNSVFPTEIFATVFPSGIRSMDSAAPFKASEEDCMIQHSSGHHKRRPDYFTRRKAVSQSLLVTNIFTFQRWAAKHG